MALYVIITKLSPEHIALQSIIDVAVTSMHKATI